MDKIKDEEKQNQFQRMTAFNFQKKFKKLLTNI